MLALLPGAIVPSVRVSVDSAHFDRYRTVRRKQPKKPMPIALRENEGQETPVAELPDLDLTTAYDYELPEELIAAVPAPSRDESRLLFVGSKVEHNRFPQLPTMLRRGDLLVRNAVRVVPARVLGRKPTGGKVELLVLEPIDMDWATPGPLHFRALYRCSKPLRVGTVISVGEGVEIAVLKAAAGTAELASNTDLSLVELLDAVGAVPLPPYIRARRRQSGATIDPALDRDRYQTVYAAEPGAVAAPTAGLHFSTDLLQQLETVGIEIASIRLDVGVGTFRPVAAERLSEHHLHSERYVISKCAAAQINAALSERRRIIAIGTTSVRTLEDQARRGTRCQSGAFETDLFIHPGVAIRWIDGLITNFHLPRSSLLALVCTFAGYRRVMAAYRSAVECGYRFYSYGDAMLLWPDGSCESL